jgi:hypothetical protein
MSAEELHDMEQRLQEGLDQAQYKMLLDKAIKNQNVVRCNEKGLYEQSARDALAEVYHQELDAPNKVREFANQ